MDFRTLFNLIFGALLYLSGVAGGHAVAATPARKAIPSPKSTLQAGQKETHARLGANKAAAPESARIEVGWSMVRSKVTAYGATSRNENFREVWHLWRRSDGSLLLISPRAKVVVHQATPDQSIVTNEGDLAALLGLLPRPEDMVKGQSALVANAMAKPISIGVKDPHNPLTANFNFGDEESYAVQLEVNNLRPE